MVPSMFSIEGALSHLKYCENFRKVSLTSAQQQCPHDHLNPVQAGGVQHSGLQSAECSRKNWIQVVNYSVECREISVGNISCWLLDNFTKMSVEWICRLHQYNACPTSGWWRAPPSCPASRSSRQKTSSGLCIEALTRRIWAETEGVPLFRGCAQLCAVQYLQVYSTLCRT